MGQYSNSLYNHFRNIYYSLTLHNVHKMKKYRKIIKELCLLIAAMFIGFAIGKTFAEFILIPIYKCFIK